ncbi:hypothetical protein K439DRAFT_1632640 [Ramaria rubella]|nr:hypothetical protein K439DRAFT_1632640 [Ramaria rubella]
MILSLTAQLCLGAILAYLGNLEPYSVHSFEALANNIDRASTGVMHQCQLRSFPERQYISTGIWPMAIALRGTILSMTFPGFWLFFSERHSDSRAEHVQGHASFTIPEA